MKFDKLQLSEANIAWATVARPERRRHRSHAPGIWRHILAPLDLSEHSVTVLRYAAELARKCGAALHLLHVAEPATFLSGIKDVPLALTNEEMAQQAGARLKTLAGEVLGITPRPSQVSAPAESSPWPDPEPDEPGGRRPENASDLTVDYTVKIGRLADELETVVRDLGIDLVVLTTHGHTGLKRCWFGSTALRMLKQATCPLLVLPTGAGKA